MEKIYGDHLRRLSVHKEVDPFFNTTISARTRCRIHNKTMREINKYLDFHIGDVVGVEPGSGDTLLGGYINQFDITILGSTD